MKEFKVLKVLDRFKGLFTKVGVDYPVMRNILQLKLTLDSRRVPTIMKNNKRKNNGPDDNKNYFIRSLWVYVFLSVFILPLTLMGENYMFQMSITFGIIFFMTMSTLISDFSSVLLDIRDKNILLIRPVNKKTINMAKILHILYYLFAISASLTTIPFIGLLFRRGILFALLFLIEVIWINLLVVVLAALFYIAILKIFDGEKLKDIINYSQIVLTLTITIGYQFISRLFEVAEVNASFTPKWWQYLIIPAWFAGPFELLFHHNIHIHYIMFSLLTLIVPIILIVLYIKLIPTFERNLQKLSAIGAKTKTKSNSLIQTIGKLVIRNNQEFIMYKFSLNMFKTEREFKLKSYPSLGMSLIFPFIFLFNVSRDSSFEELQGSKAYFFIYFCILILPTLIQMIQYSEKHKGSWIYYVLPVEKYGHLHSGAIKAIMLQFILPLFFIESGIFIYIFGAGIILDLIIVFINMLIYTALIYLASDKSLPFSQKFVVGNQGGSSAKLIGYMFILAIVGGIHFGLSYIPWFRIPYIIISVTITIFIWIKMFKKLERQNRLVTE